MVDDHATLLRGASFSKAPSGQGAPVLLERTDQDFLNAVLDQLGDAGKRADLASDLAKTREADGTLKLFQPVHRTFHLAVLEVSCDTPGSPRLDPQKIDSAGLVVRRVAGRGPAAGTEGWMKAGKKLRGWVRLGPGEEALDPEPPRRRAALNSGLRSGHPEIDRRLAILHGASEPAEESAVTLFVAPPEVCKAAGKTFIYGLVPLTSSERSETPVSPAPLDAKTVGDQLSVLFKATSKNTSYSWLGKTLTADSAAGSGGLKTDFETLNTCLQQLHLQLDAIDGEGSEVRRVLDRIPLPYGNSTKPAGQVLADAAEALLLRTGKVTSVTMPDAWPALAADVRQSLLTAAQAAMGKRLGELTAGEGRFDRPTRRYQVRAFVRVKCDDGCPPKLVWSAPSEPFLIAPWFDAGAAPPTRITLPDFRDRKALRKLKPNVAFVMPDGLKEMIDGSDLKGLMDGKKGLGIGIQWICGFNIPLITLCAFFVLNIFFSLLNIVFFWFPFLKICIPFPVPTEE
jgi:hypothetical protein